jgi:hypothetical protein
VLSAALAVSYPTRNPSWQQATQQVVEAAWRQPFLNGLTEINTACVYIACMAPRNHASSVDSYGTAILTSPNGFAAEVAP